MACFKLNLYILDVEFQPVLQQIDVDPQGLSFLLGLDDSFGHLKFFPYDLALFFSFKIYLFVLPKALTVVCSRHAFYIRKFLHGKFRVQI